MFTTMIRGLTFIILFHKACWTILLLIIFCLNPVEWRPCFKIGLWKIPGILFVTNKTLQRTKYRIGAIVYRLKWHNLITPLPKRDRYKLYKSNKTNDLIIFQPCIENNKQNVENYSFYKKYYCVFFLNFLQAN